MQIRMVTDVHSAFVCAGRDLLGILGFKLANYVAHMLIRLQNWVRPLLVAGIDYILHTEVWLHAVDTAEVWADWTGWAIWAAWQIFLILAEEFLQALGWLLLCFICFIIYGFWFLVGVLLYYPLQVRNRFAAVIDDWAAQLALEPAELALPYEEDIDDDHDHGLVVRRKINHRCPPRGRCLNRHICRRPRATKRVKIRKEMSYQDIIDFHIMMQPNDGNEYCPHWEMEQQRAERRTRTRLDYYKDMVDREEAAYNAWAFDD